MSHRDPGGQNGMTQASQERPSDWGQRRKAFLNHPRSPELTTGQCSQLTTARGLLLSANRLTHSVH